MKTLRDDNYDRRTDVQKCWYQNICERYGTSECDYTCKKFTQTDYLFQLSNLPPSCWKSQKLDMSFLDTEVSDPLSMILNDIEFICIDAWLSDLGVLPKNDCINPIDSFPW